MTTHYINWRAEESHEKLWGLEETAGDDHGRSDRCNRAVREALAKLSDVEQAIVLRRHFDGKSLPDIADELGYPTPDIVNLHSHAMRVLREKLKDFVRAEFGIPTPKKRCVLCQSTRRIDIDRFLADNEGGRSFQSVMRELNSRFGVKLKSHMTIVAHVNFHNREVSS